MDGNTSGQSEERACFAQHDIILISTADWDNPFWTNKQHVTMELARQGHRVLYIESLALRRPTLTGRDISRVVRRLKRGFSPPRRVNNRVWVWSPIVVPLHNIKSIQKLNRLLLSLGVGFYSKLMRLDFKVVWTYSPMTTRLFELNSIRMLVYHAVDDIKAQPGMPFSAIQEAEEDLLNRADLTFVTSLNLQNMHKASGRNVIYYSNVADFGHFNKAIDPELEEPEDMKAISGPRLTLIGAISGYKVDFELLRDVARARPEWSLVLIGDVGEGDPHTNAEVLKVCPNIHLLGPRPYEELPAYLKASHVAILANRENDYTRSMFPMKFFEYLAAGRPVVSTPLDALRDYSDVATFARGAEAYIAAVEAALDGRAAPLESRLARARENTYAVRTERMMRDVEQVMAGKL